MGWKPADTIAVALFNFDGQNDRHLSLHVGDLVYILEETPEWYRGYLYYQPTRRGIFPASYVHMKEHTTTKLGNKTYVVPAEDEVTLEAKESLREWRTQLFKLYVGAPREHYRRLLHYMEDVLAWRRNIINSNATHDAMHAMKTKLTAKIDLVNSKVNCPQTPRDQRGQVVDCYKTNIQELFRLHQERKEEIDQHVTQTGALQEKRAAKAPQSQVHHLFMRVDHVDHQFPEDCEVFFFLYDHVTRDTISERFSMEVKKSAPGFHDQERHSAVFTDLGCKDMQATSIHLVCQIIRKGKMLLDDRKSTSQHHFRRPYAVGVLDVVSVLQAKEDAEWMHEEECSFTLTMPLYVCSTNHESDFATFHVTAIRKMGAKGGQKPGCAIQLSLRTFHGELQQLRRDFPSLFTKGTMTVHKLGFPDVILPGDVRNDIYVTLEHGQFEKGHKRAERNVEVAISIIDNQGNTIPRAIVLGSGLPPISDFESFIFYHNNNPKWNETVKLSIPFEKLPDAHLRISFRHVAKNEPKDKAEKTFAFAYMKIMNDNGSIIEDGTHELYVYKAEGKRWYDPRVYLSHASRKEDVIRQQRTLAGAKPLVDGPNVQLSRSFREMIYFSSLTCSTKLTQKIELLLLLKWKQKERDLSVVLRNLAGIDGEEVVKFLQDTLDCLFDILNTNSQKYGELVFDALVSIFSLMSDDRYQHFTTVLDIYIAKHYSAILAYKFLIHCFCKSVSELCGNADTHPKLIRILKSMQYLFRFIVQSHELYFRHNQRKDPSFKEDAQRTFGSFQTLMTMQENKVKGIHMVQCALLKNFPLILPEIAESFSEFEIASLISHFLDSIRNTSASVPGEKLTFILSVLNGPIKLLRSHDPRQCLVPTLVSHLISHMDHMMPRSNYSPDNKSNRDCISCVASLLESLADKSLKISFHDTENIVPLILPLLRLCKQVPSINPLARLNQMNFIGLLDLMHNEHYTTLFESQKSTYENALKEFVEDLMGVLRHMITHPPYPQDWVAIFFVQNRVIMRALQNTSTALIDGFLNDTSFTPQIWDRFFALCTLFVTQPCLQLERFSEYRKYQYEQQFGDMRLMMGKHVLSMWHKLSDKKGNFIPNLIGPFLEITLVRQKELRKESLPLIFDIMNCEQLASTNFKRVETEVFDKMDDLITKGWGDEEYKEMFHDILQAQCANSRGLEGGSMFIDSVSRLIALLLDYRNVSSEECHKGRRMGCMLNLLNFYLEIEKEELYIRYIYKLAELHEKDHSYTEAGYTLLLHARGLKWSGDTVLALGRYPQQTARERKEQLYLDAIRLFDQGKSWECGIPLCKELADLYETDLFDYQKLATTLNRQAEFFQKIIRELRVEPEYFMVGYYGRGFPLFLRNKRFVHRGLPYERLGSFINRLTDEFSTAQILKTAGCNPPDSDVQNSSGLHVVVRTVLPLPEDREIFKGKRVSDKIKQYYKTNDVRRFCYDRPFHRGEKDKDCEFATLWIERSTFTTNDSFPGVITWFEISDTNTVELNPLDIAIETMRSKILEIQTLTGLYSADKTRNINPLSMLLNGVIDAAVMGGISNYEKIFFNEVYTKEHPDHVEGVQKLRTLVEEQTSLLGKALSLHGQLIETSLQGLQDKLEGCYEELQYIVFPEKQRQGSSIARSRSKGKTTTLRPLPPTPFQQQQASAQNKRASGLQTLPGKIVRRATGVPGKLKQKVYEDTEFIEPLRKPPKRSATTSKQQRNSLSMSPSNARKRLSRSHSGENLNLKENESQPGSTQSSTGSINRLSEDETYERVEDFLAVSVKLSSSPSDIPEGIEDRRGSHPPPSYPAPLPPDGEAPIMDHDYEPVHIGQPTDTPDRYDGSEQRVSLPYVGAITVGAGKMGVKRTVSEPAVASSPPRDMCERSPTSPLMKFDQAPLPSIQEASDNWVETKAGKVRIPPAPTSPPPSPPRNTSSPSVPKKSPRSPPAIATQQQKAIDEDVYVFDHLPEAAASVEQQPKLPPKQRKTKLSESRGGEDEGVYSFDQLRDVSKKKESPKLPPKQRQLQPSPREKTPVDDEVYAFDNLSPQPNTQPQPFDYGQPYFDHLVSGNLPQPENGGGVREDVYFDHLFTGEGDEGPPQHDQVYFDHLVTLSDQQESPTKKGLPPPKPLPYASPQKPPEADVPPPIPRKRSKTIKRESTDTPQTPKLQLSGEMNDLAEADVERPRPVPRQRTSTLERKSYNTVDGPPLPMAQSAPSSGEYGHLSPPSLPPKPSNPYLPPKPSKPPIVPPREKEHSGDAKPPPIPQKPSNWRHMTAKR